MKKIKNKTVDRTASIDGIIIGGIICLIIPFAFFRSAFDPVLYPRLAAWSGAAILLGIAGYIVHRKQEHLNIPLKHPFIIIFIFYLVWSAFALLWAGNPIEGLTDVFKWLTFVLFVLLLYVFLSINRRTWEITVKGVVLYSLFTSIYGYMQFFEFVPRQSDVNAVYEVTGLMAHKNQLSIALFLFIPFHFYGWIKFKGGWKKATQAAFIAVVLLIMLLGTRAVWLAMIAASICFVFFYLWTQKRIGTEKFKKWSGLVIWIIGITISVFILSFLFFPDEFILNRITGRFLSVLDPDFTSNKWRAEMWQATLNLYLDNPIFGVGTGNWKIEIYPYYSEYQPSVFRHWRNPHNDYLLVASEKGLIGLVLFILIYLVPFILALQQAKQQKDSSDRLVMLIFSVVILSYMFVSLFSFPGERVHHHVFLALLITFILVAATNSKKMFLYRIKRAFLIWIPLVLLLPVFLFSIRTVTAEMNLKKAFALQKAEKFNPMIRYVEKANFRWAPLEPRSSCPVQFYKGYAKYKQKSYAEAKQIFLRSYTLHPHNQMITNNLGSVYGQLSKYDSAAYFFKRSIELLPRYEVGLINLSKVYYLQKDYEKAYQTILACDPNSENEEIRQLREIVKQILNGAQD